MKECKKKAKKFLFKILRKKSRFQKAIHKVKDLMSI